MQASRPAFPFSKYCSVVCIFLTPSPTPNEPRASGSSRQGWQKKKIPQKILLQKFFEACVFSFIPYVYQLQLQSVWI
jgi:hypothetical protein